MNYLDNGILREPVKWLYMIMAALNLLFPLWLIYKAIDANMFDYMPAKFIIVFVLIWLVLMAGGIGLAILWWKRKDQLKETPAGDEYPATPVAASIIRTFGEWIGLYIGVVLFLVSLIALIFGADSLGSALDLPISAGLVSIILLPIWGLLTIIGTRFFAEQILALIAIAKNTKK